MIRRTGFTLVEIMIVVVIMAILAGTVIPQFAFNTDQAAESVAQHNLNSLRAQILLYKAEHPGKFPSSDLNELTTSTNISGAVGTGANYRYGPYFTSIPVNP